MSYPPLPSNGETNWGTKFRTWADALEGRKVEGNGMSLRRDTTVGESVFLDYPGGSTMLSGDTGIRKLSARDQSGVTGDIFIRRYNNTVSIWSTGLVIPGSSLFAVLLTDLPNFAPSGGIAGSGNASLQHQGITVGTFEYAGFYQFRIRALSNPGQLTFSSTFLTSAFFPPTLPGTPA